VRYGEQPIDVSGEVYTIGQVIIYTIKEDEIAAPNPVYQTIMDEFEHHFQEPGFKAEQFFKFHPDQQVSALAIDMITEKYRFIKAEYDSNLGELVTRLLLEMKLTVIQMQIADLETGLKEAQETGNWELQVQLLARQPELISRRNALCKLLGNRVINL
jgi:DNA primase